MSNNNANSEKFLPSPSSNNYAARHTPTISNNSDAVNNNDQISDPSTTTSATSFLASDQLMAGVLQIFEPPHAKVRINLKELIGKQNKIYIDLSAEKHKFDNAEIAALQEMMKNIKVYREKLIKIKKQMTNIYQKTKVLKKRAININSCKQRELSRKLQRQQLEESLIAKQQDQQQSEQQ